jgi:hypothetical protein
MDFLTNKNLAYFQNTIMILHLLLSFEIIILSEKTKMLKDFEYPESLIS